MSTDISSILFTPITIDQQQMTKEIIAVILILFLIILLLLGLVIVLILILCRTRLSALSTTNSCRRLHQTAEKHRYARVSTTESLPKLTFNGETTSDKQLDADAENVHCPQPSPVNSCLLSEPHDDDQFLPSSCIIEIEPPSADNHDEYLLDGDSLEQIHPDDLDATVINGTLSTTIRSTHLDAIVEDSNEENSDDLDETIQPVRLCCDREIGIDAMDLHSRLFDLSQMNHVVAQFNENGNLLGDFTRQIGKLKSKSNDIIRASAQMPRDAELLEARYSTLLSTIESLSLLLKIAQIPASRSLINRLVFSIEQRMDQLNQLIQLSSALAMRSSQRRDPNDDDFLSFRSALSSYEHLFTQTS